jgi:hypothetical protein
MFSGLFQVLSVWFSIIHMVFNLFFICLLSENSGAKRLSWLCYCDKVRKLIGFVRYNECYMRHVQDYQKFIIIINDQLCF